MRKTSGEAARQEASTAAMTESSFFSSLTLARRGGGGVAKDCCADCVKGRRYWRVLLRQDEHIEDVRERNVRNAELDAILGCCRCGPAVVASQLRFPEAWLGRLEVDGKKVAMEARALLSSDAEETLPPPDFSFPIPSCACELTCRSQACRVIIFCSSSLVYSSRRG